MVDLPAPEAPTIPVVTPKVQTVGDTMIITGNAAAVNQVKLIARVASPEHESHGLGQQPSGHEGQCHCRCLIEPLGIIDDTHHRAAL